jgi:hypothetical protein
VRSPKLSFTLAMFHFGIVLSCGRLSSGDSISQNSNQKFETTPLQSVRFVAASHEKRLAIATAVSTAVAERLGALCKEQNITLRKEGYFACQESDCEITSTRVETPGKSEINIYAALNRGQWSVSVEFGFTRPQSNTLLICSAPQLMSVVRQSYSDIMLDWRIAE